MGLNRDVGRYWQIKPLYFYGAPTLVWLLCCTSPAWWALLSCGNIGVSGYILNPLSPRHCIGSVGESEELPLDLLCFPVYDMVFFLLPLSCRETRIFAGEKNKR